MTDLHKDEKSKGVNVLVAGCIHGFWDELVEAVSNEIKNGNKIDVVLVNGDNQTFRTEEDMESSSSYKEIREQKPNKYGKPPKYTLEQFYGSFHKYVNSDAKLPCLFILIGGNNESQDILFQMPYGGFIAENIYYAGRASILDYKGLRISALSGIFFDKFFNLPVFEKFPIRDPSDMKTSYYLRSFSVYQLLCYKNIPESPKIKVMMTHDWPIEFNDNHEKKEIFRNIIIDDPKWEIIDSGNLYDCDLLSVLKPTFWTAAHHHIKYEADYVSGDNSSHFIANPRPNDEPPFYRILHFNYDELNPETRDSSILTFAPEWIAILKSTQDFKDIREEFDSNKWNKIQDRKDSIFHNLEEIKTKQASDSTYLEVPNNIYDTTTNSLPTNNICSKYQIQPPPIEGKPPITNDRGRGQNRGRRGNQRGQNRGGRRGGWRGRNRGGY